MTVHELNRDEITELKVDMYPQKHDDTISYLEINNIDELVSDEEVFEEAAECDFSKDDFFCDS